ncbi:YcgJ family protein [Dongia sp.]|uniref:YcgJ family protein n=1 Tax=Dongia sp. TaxID=1977262 RepID=UPI0035AF643A
MPRWSLTRTVPKRRAVLLAGLALTSMALAACTSTPPPKPVQLRAISSGEGVDLATYAHGNPSPYGYATPWGQPSAETTGYLGANRFSPAPGLICERGRNVCYDRNGIDLAATERYLGSRDEWNRQRLYGDAKIYVPARQ